jgi:hypothetical protein
MELHLDRSEARDARAIQQAIDAVAVTGGRVVLPAMEVELDRALVLRSGVELVGQGPASVLRQGAGRVYPLTGYHNYGMADVPLETTEGLAVGMTVSVHDDRTHGGFYETLAQITWIDGNWVGLDHGIEADYQAAAHPCLTTVRPIVMGHDLQGAAVRGLGLAGGREHSPQAMGGCRGGAVYFARCRGLEIEGVEEAGYLGEGLSFQMCRDVVIRHCAFNHNSGNGLHPGAGSTNALFSGCSARGNERSGFFFCVRANHITVRDCVFRDNDTGVSVGTRDCHNLLESCSVAANHGSGILFRDSPRPTEVHSCWVHRCRVHGNAQAQGHTQVEVHSDAHDLVLSECDLGAAVGRPAVRVAPTVRRLFLDGLRHDDAIGSIAADPASLTTTPSAFACGYGDWPESVYRHLALA